MGPGVKDRKAVERDGFNCWTCLGSSNTAGSQKSSSYAAGSKIQKLASIKSHDFILLKVVCKNTFISVW
jgi:hypothetical protein